MIRRCVRYGRAREHTSSSTRKCIKLARDWSWVVFDLVAGRHIAIEGKTFRRHRPTKRAHSSEAKPFAASFRRPRSSREANTSHTLTIQARLDRPAHGRFFESFLNLASASLFAMILCATSAAMSNRRPLVSVIISSSSMVDAMM
jgi:hypothetical protein